MDQAQILADRFLEFHSSLNPVGDCPIGEVFSYGVPQVIRVFDFTCLQKGLIDTAPCRARDRDTPDQRVPAYAGTAN